MVYKINFFMITKKTMFAMIVCLMFPFAGLAQNGSLYLMPSVQMFSFKNINLALNDAGFAETPLTFGSGAGGFGEYNRWRFGGEGTYFSGDKMLNGKSTSLEGGWGYFYAGYHLTENSWRLIPQLGIGFGGASLHAIMPTTSNNINDLLSQGNGSSLTIASTFAHTALSIEKNIQSGFYMGLKSSYNLAVGGPSAWKANGLAVAPEDAFSGFQLALIVGFILK